MSDKSNQDIKGDLKNLWKATVDQFDELKDVIVKGSHAGQARLDAAFLEREREARLRELGELVYQYGPKDDMPGPWKEKFNEIRDLEQKVASQREEFDDLVKGVKDHIPDLTGLVNEDPAQQPKKEAAKTQDAKTQDAAEKPPASKGGEAAAEADVNKAEKPDV